MKHLNDNYALGLLKSSKSSVKIALLLGITKRYANKLRQRLKEEGETCLSNKIKVSRENGKLIRKLKIK